jgi:hypothetical protein
MYYKNKQSVESAQVLPMLTSSNISSSLWIVATPKEKMKKNVFNIVDLQNTRGTLQALHTNKLPRS